MSDKKNPRPLFCYHCGAMATSKEHAPARCIFPKFPEYRENLVTVPSCDAHNSEKSDLDQYFFLAITMICSDFSVSREARDEQVQRLIRSFSRKWKLDYEPTIAQLVGREFPVRVLLRMSSSTGYRPEYVLAIEYKTERFLSYLDSLARALFWKEYGYSWRWRIIVRPHSAAYPSLYSELREVESLMFSGDAPILGSCPDVFSYRIHEFNNGSNMKSTIWMAFNKSFYVHVTFLRE